MPSRAGGGRLSKFRRDAESVNAKLSKARSKQGALDKAPIALQQAVLAPKKVLAPPRLLVTSNDRPPTWLPANLNSAIDRPPTWLPANLNLAIATRVPKAIAASNARAARRAVLRLSPAPLKLVASSRAAATKVVVAKPKIGRTTSRRKRVNYAGPSSLLDLRWPEYGSLHDIQTLLGIAPPPEGLQHALGLVKKPDQPANAVLVSIDAEFERSGLIDHVVEVGITILRIADIYGMDPGLRIRNWSGAMEHRHIVLDVTRKPKYRMRGSLFGKSLFMGAEDAKAAINRILHAAATHRPLPTGHPWNPDPAFDDTLEPRQPADLILVGQSIASDIAALKIRPLHIDLQPTAGSTTLPQDGEFAPTVSSQAGLPRFKAIFDTLALTQQARKLGAEFPSAKLGFVARLIGVDPEYWEGSSVIGAHNASNDAAYTMMVLLLHAIRGESLVKQGALEDAPAENEPVVYRSVMPPQKKSKGWRKVLVRLGAVGLVAGLVQLALLGLGLDSHTDEDDADGEG
ncbi:hypothetical protein LTR29_011745 [Friedmanniomyces endolithicus]|nr:hypothetical protein LTR29_011745 [Friedmanniomyces endolithicus]